jgi:uncharacterized protein (TIGR02271 family)
MKLNDSTARRVPIVVVDMSGLEGAIDPSHSAFTDAESNDPGSNDAGKRILVRFENGQELLVPQELLKVQADGRYRLMARVDDLMTTQSSTLRAGVSEANSLVVPVTEEKVTVQKRVVEKGRVEIHKSVHERTEVVDQPLHMEEVEIERVAINRVIDEVAPIRQEGDTTIIPILEEVLVIEKRLVLREEVHIKKLQTIVHDPQEVLLRAERVDIIRNPGNEVQEK